MRNVSILVVTLLCFHTVKITAQLRVPQDALVKILQAEDERRWDGDLKSLLSDKNPAIRRRAALAAGRIGDEGALPSLSALISTDADPKVRELAIFAIGEIESVQGADALIAILKSSKEAASLRARAVEALGKISAALPDEQAKRKLELNEVILETLKADRGDEQTILLVLTAVLRCRVANSGPVVAEFLSNASPRVRADSANALARLRAKDGGAQLQELLAKDKDPIVRANAARALGAAENHDAFAALLDHALTDTDLRVRVSAVRALASLKDARAAEPLLKRGDALATAGEANEVLEIATTIGRLLQNANNEAAFAWLKRVRTGFSNAAPEVEIAFARISPSAYLQTIGWEATVFSKGEKGALDNWRARANVAQALMEIANAPEATPNRNVLKTQAESLAKTLLAANDSLISSGNKNVEASFSIPELLRAFAEFKPEGLGEVLRKHLAFDDAIVRSAAADLIGELAPDTANERALVEALPRAMHDELNDAALSILESLAKQKTATANEAIKRALASQDHLLRRRAVMLLKANGVGDFSARIGTVKTRNTLADYKRAAARAGRIIRATVTTTQRDNRPGSFVIEFLPEEAPLTVDNFIRLAQKNYFNGQTIPRVVANFVVQAGDPRGDQNGGPGYTIRCEINEVPYDRAAVGMALSGKDTGGSQWFVTHAPQPHLDGGYTVFGRVVSGMDVVDRIERGDSIVSVTISERALPRTTSRN
jgi:cyclophilin family peptidyl-prolyl cis-trans isomerase/HEAT repeat protein